MTRSAFVETGERTSLLPKALTYGFSLDFSYHLDTERAPGPLKLDELAEKPRTFHVSDRDFITTVDGALREVPKVTLDEAEDFLAASQDVVNLKGRLLFDKGTNPLVITYSGVLNVPGGTEYWLDPDPVRPVKAATAFVYSRQDYVGAKYRSLVWNQLIAVGRFVPDRRPAYRQAPALVLHVSLDFYIPS
jgi:hypothetical protein